MRHPWKDQKKHTPYFNVPFFTLINAHLPLALQSIQCVDAFECWRVFFLETHCAHSWGGMLSHDDLVSQLFFPFLVWKLTKRWTYGRDMGAALKQTRRPGRKSTLTPSFTCDPKLPGWASEFYFSDWNLGDHLGRKPPMLLCQGIAWKRNQWNSLPKCLGNDGERKSTGGKLFGENWDTCLAIRLSGKIVLPHEIEGSWARPLSPFRTPDIMQG